MTLGFTVIVHSYISESWENRVLNRLNFFVHLVGLKDTDTTLRAIGLNSLMKEIVLVDDYQARNKAKRDIKQGVGNDSHSNPLPEDVGNVLIPSVVWVNSISTMKLF